jgi:hypothetical protein
MDHFHGELYPKKDKEMFVDVSNEKGFITWIR